MPSRVLNGLPSVPSTVPNATCSVITSSGRKPALPGDREHLLEVVGLPRVHHVDDPVGVEVPDPVPDRRQVRCRVAEAAVASCGRSSAR